MSNLRATLLSRIGITQWHQRHPLAGAPQMCHLAIVADQLPASSLLSDLCHYLKIATNEVSLVAEVPSPAPRWIWLLEPDNRYPNAWVLPLNPNSEQKRIWWQQLSQMSITR